MKQFILIIGSLLLFQVSENSNAQILGTVSVGDVFYKGKNSQYRPGEDLSADLKVGLESALLKSRKFNVLNSEELLKRLQKQRRDLPSYYANSYASKPYDQAGLDYIIKVDINDFGVFKQKRGESDALVVMLGLGFNMYGISDVTEDIVDSVAAQVVSKQQGYENQDALQSLIDEALQKAVNQIQDKIISKLFPLRVMSLSDTGDIKLNYGDGLLSVGDTLVVSPADIEIKIDVSGEVLSDIIATIKIVSTERKFSIAQALEGYEKLEKGQQATLLRSDN